MDVPSQHLITVNANHHHEYLVNRLWEYLKNKTKTDMCILSSGQTILAHRLILEVFTSQEKIGNAALHDNGSYLSKILEFMYTGAIRVQPDDLDSLLVVANEMGFEMLVDALRVAMNNCQISPEKLEHENSDVSPELIIPKVEHGYDACHVKQEPVDQSSDEDFDMAETENVALENVECDILEDQEEVSDADKRDIGACSSNVVAGWNESQPGTSHGAVPTVYHSDSNFANSTRLPQNRLGRPSRQNYSESDPLLATDCEGSAVGANISTRERTAGELAPAEASGLTHKQKRLRNLNAVSHGNAAKLSEPYNPNNKVEGTEGEEGSRGRVRCSVCWKLMSVDSLARHMRIHTGERPYACHLCQKTFSQSGSLSLHMRIHTGERPHACHVCQKTFSQSGSLSIHMRIHSKEMETP